KETEGVVDEEVVAEVISKMTGVPLKQVELITYQLKPEYKEKLLPDSLPAAVVEKLQPLCHQPPVHEQPPVPAKDFRKLLKEVLSEAEYEEHAKRILKVAMIDNETTRLLHMEQELHTAVVSQHEAIVAIAKAVRKSRAGLKDPKRPIGSFIFAGPTGVGKTLLAKRLAAFMFGDENALVQIDMSEYMEKHNVS